ncbi:ComF family protein [Amycolatopsis sp. VS8301801F10]|uniref:ComF family protein n=1 Tax=Amycolatopsis sp. VS8301801F10 TaxID=2652442 RepID=UPI0038FC6BAE
MVLRLLLNLLLPTYCAGCETRGAPVCAGCSKIWGSPTAVFRAPLATLAPAYALARYAGVAKRTLIAYKERRRRDVAPFLGRALAAGLLALPSGGPRASPWCLVPAPSRRTASRVRGGPHVQRIAREAARLTGAYVTPALVLKGGQDAVGLSRAERVANLEGRLRFAEAGRPPPGTRVVVVDDVLTTGVTSAACVTALKNAGVPVVAVLALLATV